MRTVLTRREQYYAYNDGRGGHLAKEMTLAKAKNQYAVLGTLAKTRKETEPRVAERLMEARQMIRQGISKLEGLCEDTVDLIRASIMGIEGLVSSAYWQGVASMIPDEFRFGERSGRGARDPVNSALNYGYGILDGEVWRAVNFARLDPYGGFLHVDRPGRPSMVLDLMEEFRQQLVDKNVFAPISRRMVSPGHFVIEEGMCRLRNGARRLLLQGILEKIGVRELGR